MDIYICVCVCGCTVGALVLWVGAHAVDHFGLDEDFDDSIFDWLSVRGCCLSLSLTMCLCGCGCVHSSRTHTPISTHVHCM